MDKESEKNSLSELAGLVKKIDLSAAVPEAPKKTASEENPERAELQEAKEQVTGAAGFAVSLGKNVRELTKKKPEKQEAPVQQPEQKQRKAKKPEKQTVAESMQSALPEQHEASASAPMVEETTAAHPNSGRVLLEKNHHQEAGLPQDTLTLRPSELKIREHDLPSTEQMLMPAEKPEDTADWGQELRLHPDREKSMPQSSFLRSEEPVVKVREHEPELATHTLKLRVEGDNAVANTSEGKTGAVVEEPAGDEILPARQDDVRVTDRTAGASGSSPLVDREENKTSHFRTTPEEPATETVEVNSAPQKNRAGSRNRDPLYSKGEYTATARWDSVGQSQSGTGEVQGNGVVENRSVRENPSGEREVRLRGQGIPGEDRSLRLNGEEIQQIDRSAKLIEQGGEKTAAALQEAGKTAENTAEGIAEDAAGPIGIAIQVAQRVQQDVSRALASFSGDGINPIGNDRSGVFSVLHLGTTLIVGGMLFLLPIFGIVLFLSILTGAGNKDLSEHVKAWMPQISAACQKYEIAEYVPLVAAIMMQESGGDAELVRGDVMQCAEGMGYPVGTAITPEASIDFGVKLISELLQEAGVTGPTDMDRLKLAVQAYNFGGGYISYALSRDGKYTKENAVAYAERQAAAMGWSDYGDSEYVDHVFRYYTTSTGGGAGEPSELFPELRYPMDGCRWITYSNHEGIDLQCDVGTPVYASATGTVWYSYGSWTEADGKSGMMSYGNAVCITHAGDMETRYAHLSSVVVSAGQQVLQGQLIGYSGNTGNSTGPHMHLAVYFDGSPGERGENNYAAQAFRKFQG